MRKAGGGAKSSTEETACQAASSPPDLVGGPAQPGGHVAKGGRYQLPRRRYDNPKKRFPPSVVLKGKLRGQNRAKRRQIGPPRRMRASNLIVVKIGSLRSLGGSRSSTACHVGSLEARRAPPTPTCRPKAAPEFILESWGRYRAFQARFTSSGRARSGSTCANDTQPPGNQEFSGGRGSQNLASHSSGGISGLTI